jgi:hypothetical protein
MSTETDIAKVMNMLEKVQADRVRSTAIKFMGHVTKETPVDTGRARANWNMSADAPDFTTTENTAIPDVTTAPEGKALYVTNGLPYIVKLNEGSSQQSPAGFVERSIKLAVNNAKRGGK